MELWKLHACLLACYVSAWHMHGRHLMSFLCGLFTPKIATPEKCSVGRSPRSSGGSVGARSYAPFPRWRNSDKGCVVSP